jgi:hypothetical protein
MAIHGPVMVNDQIIAYYTIRRTEPLTDPDQLSKYDYKYEDVTIGKRTEGSVFHKYSDGAAALISRVMLCAAEDATEEEREGHLVRAQEIIASTLG